MNELLDFMVMPERFGFSPQDYQYFHQLLDKRTIIFNTDIDENIVESIYLPLREFEHDGKGKVTLILHSSGGCVTDGFFLANYIATYSAPLDIYVLGYAASMAAVILCAGGKNPNVTNTLEHLSLEGNRITIVKYDKEDNKNQNQFFQNLKVLNLAKNAIYKFEFFLEVLPKLKFLDLSSNDLPTGSFMEKAIKPDFKDKLVLLNDNMFITNSNNNNKIYIDYLNKRLPNFDFEIKNLNLNFTFDIESQFHLESLKLSTNVVISLINLDLSFCGLCTDVLVNFFKNNPKFLSLRHLSLRYNNIKGDIFEKIISNEEICLDNINYIELSENEIICNTTEKIESLSNFIEKHQNLESIQLINTGFFFELINNIKAKNSKYDKFKECFLNLKKILQENKRDFKFITNEGNITYVKEELQNFFSFRFS